MHARLLVVCQACGGLLGGGERSQILEERDGFLKKGGQLYALAVLDPRTLTLKCASSGAKSLCEVCQAAWGEMTDLDRSSLTAAIVGRHKGKQKPFPNTGQLLDFVTHTHFGGVPRFC